MRIFILSCQIGAKTKMAIYRDWRRQEIQWLGKGNMKFYECKLFFFEDTWMEANRNVS